MLGFCAVLRKPGLYIQSITPRLLNMACVTGEDLCYVVKSFKYNRTCFTDQVYDTRNLKGVFLNQLVYTIIHNKMKLINELINKLLAMQ